MKCMAWDVFGYRLAVLLDHPHDKVGSVAIFRTMGLEIQFMGYVDLDLKHRIRHSKSVSFQIHVILFIDFMRA